MSSTSLDETVSPVDLVRQVAEGPITVGTSPNSIAIAPNDERAYVVNTGDDTVLALDLPTSSAREAYPVGDSPQYIAITPDGTTAYVTNQGDDTVSPLELEITTQQRRVTRAPQQAEAIPVGSNPSGIALAPLTPPTDVAGTVTRNIFLNRTEQVLAIIWNSSTTPDVASYNVYRDGVFVTSVSALKSNRIQVSVRSAADAANYSIAAVSSSGAVTIKVAVVVS